MEKANPFTVHLGLLYINEDFGPITELLCATNTNPDMISVNPTTRNILTKMRFFILCNAIKKHINWFGATATIIIASHILTIDLIYGTIKLNATSNNYSQYNSIISDNSAHV